MDLAATALKALDLLTIVADHAGGVTVPELVQALNLPRTNVLRLLRSVELYGLIARDGRCWRTTEAFHRWAAPRDRIEALRRRYRPVLEDIAQQTNELVLLGLHEGNGVVHIDYLESDHLIRVAPAPHTRHPLGYSALGKLVLSRRADLAMAARNSKLSAELAEIRRTGIAWLREKPPHGKIVLAVPGFTNSVTEPMIAIAWPVFRFTEKKAREAIRVTGEALRRHAGGEPGPA